MERVLWLYAQPHDAAFPVVCFDERPCFLIGEELAPLSAKPGQVAREHYAYAKNGSCGLLAAIEPKTGARLARLYARRTKREYALFLRELATRYPQATKIRLVQDNLNTHDLSALYESFPPAEAFALAQRFEFFFTPKAASWLNMIETRVLGAGARVSAPAHRLLGDPGARDPRPGRRTRRQDHHAGLAVLHRHRARHFRPPLPADP